MKALRFLSAPLMMLLAFGSAHSQSVTLNHLASFETGGEGSAETVAYDPETKQAFFTSSENNSFWIIDVSNPANPTLVKEVSLSDLGGGPNSIAFSQGIVAIAIENNDRTANGVVGLFNTDGVLQNTVQAGALPDMLTFTPDGSKILVANEGEPNDDYDVDPIGSVTIITVSDLSTTTVDFSAYNDKKQSLLNKGIRIFGNNGTATVAQDMEPEYITVAPDGSVAYVNCQEANALAVLDLTTNEFIDILPLGYKNHNLGSPSIASFVLNQLVPNWPELGTPVYDGGQPPVFLGGFSGMFYSAAESSAGESIFYCVPDRGPNDGAVSAGGVTPTPPGNLRPFKLPDYQGRIVRFSVNNATGAVSLDQQIMLTRQDGTTPITGKGNVPGFDEVPVTYADPTTAYANVDFTDGDGEEYHLLPYDEFGGDFEGILVDKDGNFWMCDEYRPAIYKFDASGKLIDRYVPEGTSMLGTEPAEVGTYGNETLPAIYAKRRANRGFEAIAYDPEAEIIYAFIQSPIENPDNSVRNKSDVIRILGVDAGTGTPVSEYVYLLERNRDAGYSASRVDKIGDAVYTGNGKFLVLERDSRPGDDQFGQKFVFEIDLYAATNILEMDISDSETMPLEAMSADEIVAEGVTPVHKLKVVNLPSVGYASSDKSEGIALLPGNRIAVINDNDFGLAGAGVTDNSVLGIISFGGDYGFDASNDDGKIDIKPHQTLGMFLPDAIASYSVDGKTYVVTANEGDSRDYDGYSEEVRVKDLTLNPAYYSDIETLQEDENLGRLKTTTANGDYDGDGTTEQIYSYGARSFSIFDQYGNLVYDSGEEFGRKISVEEPTLFNEDEGEFDGRSDDKGGEPEAITIGQIGDYTYAFVGLERQSAILVYDITDPFSPKFITYYNNRTVDGGDVMGDVAPEIIKFIPSGESPNGDDMLLVGYEVSGSMGLIQVDDGITSVSEEVRDATFGMYPNPVTGGQRISFDTEVTGAVYTVNGEIVREFSNARSLDVDDLESGVYVVKTDLGVRRFVKF